jgi:hypothetical protein
LNFFLIKLGHVNVNQSEASLAVTSWVLIILCFE